MLTVFRDGAKRWLAGMAASGLLFGVMAWSAAQPALPYSLASSCSGYGSGNSQVNCQAHSGSVDPHEAVQAAAAGLPNTGQDGLLNAAAVGFDLVLVGAIVILAARRRTRRT